MKFAQEIIISWIMPFPASVVPIEFQIIRCISIQNGIRYLTDAEKKGKCNWSKNDLIMRVFLFFLNQLFIYSTICVFIYLFMLAHECLHNNEERDFFSTVDRNPDRS